MAKLIFNVVHSREIGKDNAGKTIYSNTTCGAILKKDNGHCMLILNYLPTGENPILNLYAPKAKEEAPAKQTASSDVPF